MANEIRNADGLTKEEIQHRIDAAYDCNEPELAAHWQTELAAMPSPTVAAAEPYDPSTDQYGDPCSILANSINPAVRQEYLDRELARMIAATDDRRNKVGF